jgi:hypothetical protein
VTLFTTGLIVWSLYKKYEHVSPRKRGFSNSLIPGSLDSRFRGDDEINQNFLELTLNTSSCAIIPGGAL